MAYAEDLKSFVLNGTCGFDPHPGHHHFRLELVGLQDRRQQCTSRVPRLETVRVGPGSRRAPSQPLIALVAHVPTERSASQ
jgi:hypothetical protein